MKNVLIILFFFLGNLSATGQLKIKGETTSPRLKYAYDKLTKYISAAHSVKRT
jgi:hypothetical protein